MLSYDGLIARSLERGMPAGKLRGAVREYIQILALKALYAAPRAEGLAFLGGTALRFGYDLPRFSEDLDFDVRDFSFREWKLLLEETAQALSRQGLSLEMRASEKGSLLSGDMRLQGALKAYRISENKNEKLKIKLEANRPRYPVAIDPRVISGYGEMFPAPFAASNLIMAEKILALLNRELGRDVYDLFFMADKKWRPDARILSAKGVAEDTQDVIASRLKFFGSAKLSVMAKRLEPFLFKPEQADLVAKAPTLLPDALEYLKDGGIF